MSLVTTYDNEDHVKDYGTDDHIPHMSIRTLYIHTVEYLSEPSDYDNEDHAKDYGTDDHRSSYVHMHPIYSYC